MSVAPVTSPKMKSPKSIGSGSQKYLPKWFNIAAIVAALLIGFLVSRIAGSGVAGVLTFLVVYFVVIIGFGFGAITGGVAAGLFSRTKFTVKSNTMRGDKVEMAVELFSDGVDMPYADAIRALDGVEDLTLIQYNGEYHG